MDDPFQIFLISTSLWNIVNIFYAIELIYRMCIITRTPQYHPELQPIEFCWGVVKNYCAQKCDYTKEKLKIHLEEGFQQVTPLTLQEIFKKVRCEEDRYWKEDELEDENAELLEEEPQFTAYD